MTRPRRPVVAGLAAGAGTTTVATVLHGIDGGVAARLARPLADGPATGGGHPADLLVVRNDPASLRLLADAAVGTGTVAALVLGPDAPTPLVECGVRPQAHVVAVPHIAALAEGRVPHAHLEMLLARDPASLPPALRSYAEALAAVAAALVAAGRLDRGPASGTLPVPSGPVPLARAVATPPPEAAGVADALDDALDDEALERAAS